MAALGIAESDDVAVSWLSLAGTKQVLGLGERAHRIGLTARPIDAEFREFWSQIQTVFDAVLQRFEARYLVYIKILKGLLEKDVPTPGDIKTLKEAIPRTLVAHRYFFEQLKSPQWFPGLRREGFFASPFAWYWPEAVYLRNIAQAKPQEVLNVMLSVATDGLWTHVEFAMAAKELPPELMAEWTRHEATWIRSQHQIGWPLPQKYGDVILALLSAGEMHVAIELVRSLLSIPAAPGTNSLFEEPPSRLEWMAVQHLMEEVVPSLIAQASLIAFEAFTDLLALMIEAADDDLAGVYDGSTIWRESIAHDHGLRVGLRNELVTAVRTSAAAAIHSGATTAVDVVKRLRDRKLAIFNRLALFILAQFPADTADLVTTELLSDLDRLRDDFDRREFGMLVAAGFPHLAPQDQRRVVELIYSGPDIDSFRERAEAHGYVITDAHVRRYVLQWQIRFTEAIRQHASEELGERYATWKEELASVVATLEPAPATRTVGQLREMEATEVVAYFRTIALPQRLEHSRFDLGRELQQVVAGAPEEFSRVALQVRDLDPHLIHWFLYGLNQAVSQKQYALEWPSIIGLIEFAVAQPLEMTGVFDNSWVAVRKAAASMLERALMVEEPTVPRDLVTRIWAVLVKLLGQNPGDEAVNVTESLAKTGGNAVTQAANCTRGEAFDVACRLVLWLRQTDAFALHHELIALLESILDANRCSLVMRAALGKNLLHLFDLESRWITENIDRVLPREDEHIGAWCAAWSGFLSVWRPSRDEFERLREHYSLSMRRLLATAPEHSFVTQAISQHLMNQYWPGFISLDDPLMMNFFQSAPGRLRGHALWHILHLLVEMKEALPSDVRDRIAALWTWRVAAAADQPDRTEELSWFGHFFTIGRFDEDWAVETLHSLLQLQVRIDHHRIIERLAVYSKTKPDLAFDCYKRLIALDEHRFLIDEESGREVVRNALQSGTSQEDATRFVNSLGSEGQFQFADLLV